MENTQQHVSKRFIDEKIDDHWNITADPASFECLINHLENTTSFLPFFKEAFNQFLVHHKGDELVILDLGAGVGWTSALVANHPRVKKVILVEPSVNRRNSNKHICNHFNVPDGKVERVNGTFQDFNVNEKVDAVFMCASFHHCYKEFLPILFENIGKILKNKKHGILLANEHYIKWPWIFHRMLSYMKNFTKRKNDSVFYGPGNWQAPYPFDGEHWRTRNEIVNIFSSFQYEYDISLSKNNICIKNPPLYFKLEWEYYFALLSKI